MFIRVNGGVLAPVTCAFCPGTAPHDHGVCSCPPAAPCGRVSKDELGRAAQPLPAPRPAIERRPDIHLHFHGVDADDVAAIIRQREGED
jgi:hypothetical protein